MPRSATTIFRLTGFFVTFILEPFTLCVTASDVLRTKSDIFQQFDSRPVARIQQQGLLGVQKVSKNRVLTFIRNLIPPKPPLCVNPKRNIQNGTVVIWLIFA